MRIFITIPLLYLLLFISCKKVKNEPAIELPEFFAFGTAYGECGGNCATFYSLKGGKIYIDDMEHYMCSLSFTNTPLADDKYQKAKKLAVTLPAYLINHPDTTFGCPDCHDQGLIYMEYKKNNKLMYWKIDTDIEKQPQEIRKYLVEVVDMLTQLK